MIVEERKRARDRKGLYHGKEYIYTVVWEDFMTSNPVGLTKNNYFSVLAIVVPTITVVTAAVVGIRFSIG
ncbi:MAG: hypothetical protein HDR71_13955 [Lachnospiraceae bacterium]|nr:hypothetical protein [Lachnospiraceae bacterium]